MYNEKRRLQETRERAQSIPGLGTYDSSRLTSVTIFYTVWSSNIKLSDAPVLPVFSLKYVI